MRMLVTVQSLMPNKGFLYRISNKNSMMIASNRKGHYNITIKLIVFNDLATQEVQMFSLKSQEELVIHCKDAQPTAQKVIVLTVQGPTTKLTAMTKVIFVQRISKSIRNLVLLKSILWEQQQFSSTEQTTRKVTKLLIVL